MIATLLAFGLAVANRTVLPSPDLGKANAACRPGETGPAFRVQVVGLHDRAGLLKLELYPANDQDFLADDTVLIAAGKVFRRVEVRTPQNGPAVLCIRAPGPGRYALSLLHDRDGNHRFNISSDGVGFAGNPRLGWGKPKAATASTTVAQGITVVRIVVNYRHGLSFRPDGQ
ncbi:MAG: DUF2141 domain-containing protein [Sphingomonas sp.]|jgi:uncharacterized protein (DUF2141 family)|uniref:DUF2141 domain-containing protein n=1 Tax=Sphingomonas sp. TaxID=28214 RepID=UPI001AD3670D|nr:DUF2141 domain-containing protein [Sphingomonas sp.]MBN8815927.1 DUF2141 domain-containing protein [Sphingomonas sp.]